MKGAALGLALAGGTGLYRYYLTGVPGSWPHVVACVALMTALTSFVVMNFTGASIYTSQSGVEREMRIAVPLQAAAAVIGLGSWLGGLFVA